MTEDDEGIDLSALIEVEITATVEDPLMYLRLLYGAPVRGEVVGGRYDGLEVEIR